MTSFSAGSVAAQVAGRVPDTLQLLISNFDSTLKLLPSAPQASGSVPPRLGLNERVRFCSFGNVASKPQSTGREPCLQQFPFLNFILVLQSMTISLLQSVNAVTQSFAAHTSMKLFARSNSSKRGMLTLPLGSVPVKACPDRSNRLSLGIKEAPYRTSPMSPAHARGPLHPACDFCPACQCPLKFWYNWSLSCSMVARSTKKVNSVELTNKHGAVVQEVQADNLLVLACYPRPVAHIGTRLVTPASALRSPQVETKVLDGIPQKDQTLLIATVPCETCEQSFHAV